MFSIRSCLIVVMLFMATSAQAQSPVKTVYIYLLGTGPIASNLLDLIEAKHDVLTRAYFVDIKVVAIVSKQNMLINFNGVPLKNWRNTLAKGESTSIGRFLNLMTSRPLIHAIFVDGTSLKQSPSAYQLLLNRGLAIITINPNAIPDLKGRYIVANPDAINMLQIISSVFLLNVFP